jgi:hypothetical protein
VVITDPAGNASEPSDPIGFIVDTTPPAKPTIDTVFDDVGGKTGNLTPGEITDDSTPTFSGTAEENSLVYIVVNGNVVDSVRATESGTWTWNRLRRWLTARITSALLLRIRQACVLNRPTVSTLACSPVVCQRLRRSLMLSTTSSRIPALYSITASLTTISQPSPGPVRTAPPFICTTARTRIRSAARW